MKTGRAEEILEQVHNAVLGWREFSAQAKVSDKLSAKIENALQLDIFRASQY